MKKATKIRLIVGIVLLVLLVIIGIFAYKTFSYTGHMLELHISENSKINVSSTSPVDVYAIGKEYFLLNSDNGYVEGKRFVGKNFIGEGQLQPGKWLMLNGDADLLLNASEGQLNVDITSDFETASLRFLKATFLVLLAYMACLIVTNK